VVRDFSTSMTSLMVGSAMARGWAVGGGDGGGLEWAAAAVDDWVERVGIDVTVIPGCQAPQHLTTPDCDYADCSRAPGLHREGELLPAAWES
jgi:hypothetical protein